MFTAKVLPQPYLHPVSPQGIPPTFPLVSGFQQVVFCSLPTRSAARCVRWIGTSAVQTWTFPPLKVGWLESMIRLPLGERNLPTINTWFFGRKCWFQRGSTDKMCGVSGSKLQANFIVQSISNIVPPQARQSPVQIASTMVYLWEMVIPWYANERLMKEWHMKGRMIIPHDMQLIMAALTLLAQRKVSLVEAKGMREGIPNSNPKWYMLDTFEWYWLTEPLGPCLVSWKRPASIFCEASKKQALLKILKLSTFHGMK